MAPSLSLIQLHEIEEMESENVPGLRAPLVGPRFSGQVREGLKRHEILESTPRKTAAKPP